MNRPLRRTAALTGALAVVAAAACGDAADAGAPPVSVTDSAGVRVVVRDGSVPLPVQWTVSADPEVRIGALDDEERQLSGVVGAAVLTDGRIVVADRGTATLRFFDRNGALVGTAGSRGEGPGEFAALSELAVGVGDSLHAYDIRNRTVSVFAPDGTFTRGFRLAVDESGGRGTFRGRFADGTLLVQGFANAGGGEMPEGRHVTRSALYRYSAEGAFLDSLPVVRGGDAYFQPIEFPQGMGFWFTEPLFAHGLHVQAGPGLWVADSRNARLERRGLDGRLETVVRVDGLDLDVTPERTALHRRTLLDRVEDEDERVRVERAFDAMPVPDSMPAFADLAVDDAGRAWVRAWSPGSADDAPWTVYDVDGLPVATVRIPPGLQPLHLGEDLVLGVRRDDLDVEYVELYGLERTGG